MSTYSGADFHPGEFIQKLNYNKNVCEIKYEIYVHIHHNAVQISRDICIEFLLVHVKNQNKFYLIPVDKQETGRSYHISRISRASSLKCW